MKIFIVITLLLIGMIIGLSFYLTPDDLSPCEDQPTEAQPCHTADAVVAISGGDTAARTREAIRLYKNNWAPKLIFSGAAQDKSGPSNAKVMAEEARLAGVPDSDIIIEEYGETTKQNAENSQSIFEENGIESVIVVTSAYHQRRAGLEFSKRSSSITVRNHPVMADKQWSGWWWLTPVGWYLALSEFVKIIIFYIGGSR